MHSEWPKKVLSVEIPTSDSKSQSAIWYSAEGKEKRPLLVGLHTWSSSWISSPGSYDYARWSISQNWNFIHPQFRGPNRTPEAMGSDRAVQDIVEAVAWVKANANVDEERIYLIGVSGGAHMALLMAGRHPELWTAVSAWCGISDIHQWYVEHVQNGVPDNYARDIELALEGASKDSDWLQKAEHRSPLKWLKNAKKVPLDINGGFHDGRTGSVPFLHSIRAFNEVVEGETKLDELKAAEFYETQKLPVGWSQAEADPVYQKWVPVFRRESSYARLTIFEGGHEIAHQAALNWLSAQRRGQLPVWKLPSIIPFEDAKAESGK